MSRPPGGAGAGAGAREATPDEELLLLRPRPPPAPPPGVTQPTTGFVVAHFAHVQGALGGEGARRKPLPRALRGLAAIGGLRELRLTLSRGRWDESRWGAPPGSSRELPQAGAELWVEFLPGVPASEADTAWGVLAEAVGGLLCTSLGTLAGPSGGQSVTPEGVWAGQSVGREAEGGLGPTRHGVLVGEPLCTENLSPWLTLLPCGDLRGLAAMLRRPPVAQAEFVALGLSLKVGAGTSWQPGGAVFEARQWATMALRAGEWDPSRGWAWDLQGIFGPHVLEPCPYCPVSRILVEVPALVAGSGGVKTAPAPVATAAQLVASPKAVQMPPSGAEHLEYLLQPGGIFLEQVWSPESLQPPAKAVQRGAVTAPPHVLKASQLLMGSGNRHAGIFYDVSVGEKLREGTQICMFQVVPWYAHLWLHTLRVTRSGASVPVQDFVDSMQVALSEERGRPGFWQMCFREMQSPGSFQMEVEFDKAFITVEECTPDISRGLDIPAAVFSVSPPAAAGRREGFSLAAEAAADWPATAVTEQLLMTVAHPDMSMPFNVVSFTSTALVILLSVVNRTIVRSAKPDRPLERDGRSKLASAAFFACFFAATALIGLYIDREAREEFGRFLRAHGLPFADLLAPL